MQLGDNHSCSLAEARKHLEANLSLKEIVVSAEEDQHDVLILTIHFYHDGDEECVAFCIRCLQNNDDQLLAPISIE